MSFANHQRTLAQHFLKDSYLVALLLDRSSVSPDDVVYEIGPGKGAITAQLALRCKQVVAIEKDSRLAALLRQRFAGRSNVTIAEGDFLHYPLPRKPYKVFSNIPFNITKAIVTRLTTADCEPEDAYLVMQREAAEMFLGQQHESLSTVLLKPWFAVEIVHHFRRGDFVPAPRVDVVLLRLRKRGPPLVSRADRQCFRDFVVYGFTTWRPTLGAILKGIFTGQQLKHLSRELDLNMNATPTALSFEQWLDLFASFKNVANERAIHAIAGSEQRLVQQQQRLEKNHRTRLVKSSACGYIHQKNH
ncbi:MAG TPA: 23S ribosomal RNA methyltransferase Erm [Ktedonobacteraceae bacterium]|nr:23S ribosomal RNA methyltransferase Erm [Ktedonobacteraceae bacterium]